MSDDQSISKGIKECIACGSDIVHFASVCKECGTSQSWMRYLKSSHIVLSLLVALIAILSFAIPKYQEMRISDTSSVSAEFAFADSSRAYVIISNHGKRPALIKEVSIKLGDYALMLEYSRVDSASSSSVLKARSTSILYLDPKKVIRNSLLEDFSSGEEEESKAEYVSYWLEYFPKDDNEENWEEDWIALGLRSIQQHLIELDFDALDEMTLDYEIPNNRSRIKEVERFYQDSPISDYEDDYEYIDLFNKIDSTLMFIEKYFVDKASINIDFFNSNGAREQIKISLDYHKIRDYIFTFYLSNSLPKNQLEYFFTPRN